MQIFSFKFVACAFAAILIWVAGGTEAHAGWGSHGSSGGSWGSSGGSWGSSGGSWGSHGSRGGLFARLRAHHQRKKFHGSSGGSWGSNGGSWGSSGGSWGSHGSSGGRYVYGSSGGSSGYASYGSSGGGFVRSTPYSYYSAVARPRVYTSAPVRSERATDPAPSEKTQSEDNEAVLNLRLPKETVVYVNGKRTSTPGSFRSYVSRNLRRGKNYTYEVRAELEQDGKKLTRTKVIQLTAGTTKTFEIEFDNEAELITSVTLSVPENAKVSLGGVQTSATGEIRYFSTNTLSEGQAWKNYEIEVTTNIDGKEVTRRRIVNVNAGDSVNLRFDFDSENSVVSR